MKTSQKRSISGCRWPRAAEQVRERRRRSGVKGTVPVTEGRDAGDADSRREPEGGGRRAGEARARSSRRRPRSSITGSRRGSRRSACSLPIRATKRRYASKQPSAMCWPLSGGGGGSPARSGNVWTAPPSVGRASWRTTSWPGRRARAPPPARQGRPRRPRPSREEAGSGDTELRQSGQLRRARRKRRSRSSRSARALPGRGPRTSRRRRSCGRRGGRAGSGPRRGSRAHGQPGTPSAPARRTSALPSAMSRSETPNEASSSCGR